MSTANKKSEAIKFKGHAFQTTEEKAKGTYDVVSGTLIINSLAIRVLFDSVATHSFVSQKHGVKLNVPLELLQNENVIELANDDFITVCQV